MILLKPKNISSFIKRVLAYILYFLTALAACFFAFSLVVSFLTSSFSEEAEERGGPPPQKKEVGVKDTFRDIFKTLKTVSSNFLEKKDSKKGEENQIVESKEVLNSPENNPQQAPAPVPKNFEGTEYGNTIQPVSPSSEEIVSQPLSASPSSEEIAAQPLSASPSSEEIAAQPLSASPSSEEITAQPLSASPSSEEIAAQPLSASPSSEEIAAQPLSASPSSEEITAQPLSASPSSEEITAQPLSASPSSEEIAAQPLSASPSSEEIAAQPLSASPSSEEITAQPLSASPSSEEIAAQPLSASPSSERGNLDVQSYMAPFIYDSVNQKDPFEDPTYKPLEERGAILEEAIIVVPRTPPEMYNFDEINLKGVIWNNQRPKALFELPNSGGYYSLMKGDKIGKNGVIFEIRESEVVAVETNIVGKGESKKEERTIKIKKINRIK